MTFAPVHTVADLDALDDGEILQGYLDGHSDDPGLEPGQNRRRAYWHGWRVAMMDRGLIKIDSGHRALVHEVVAARARP